ncbi:serine proteinase inhibitor [Onchocerca flexuosa]|uniref:Serine proteinase inhibitor n=1 Tax=Onchocerca flexuosa TaxID=387005 RepID=A0A238BN22_9BILA|nr:serine proteinase inhibitor [Onchocerca flexuosa]
MDRAQLNFTVALLQKLAQNDKSVILSPLSVSTSLFMIYLAANGKTKQELHNFLGGTASEYELRIYFAKVLQNMANVENENYTLHLANRFYIRQGLSTMKNFNRTLQLYYGEWLHNFGNGGKYKFVKKVNQWSSNNTNNKITELITAKSITKNTKMLLLNTIYFKGTWLSQFFPQATREMTFYISEKKKKKVNMMMKTDHLLHYEDDSVQAVRLPYVGDEIEMLLILPRIRFRLSKVLQKLTGNDLLKYIHNATPRRVQLRLPKFRLVGKWDLKEDLKELGITRAFSRLAEFTKLTYNTLFLRIMHAGRIAVDEKGTESAADTEAHWEDPLLVSRRFIADQPFLFAIVHDKKTILFAGQFGN